MSVKHAWSIPGALFWRLVSFTMVFVSVLIALGLTGCEESDKTAMEEIQHLCFEEGVDCTQLSADALLYLDTSNLPRVNGSFPKIVLRSVPVAQQTGADWIEFWFSSDDTLPAEIDPGIRNERGWKARITSARIAYLDTGNPDIDIVYFRGSLSQVEFVRDREDALDVYIRTQPLQVK
jgi:hypothetical protein